MIAEFCRLYPWTVEYVLDMPARRFFILLKEGREQKMRETAYHLADLCDVHSIALGNAEYYTEMRNRFLDRTQDEKTMMRRSGVFDAADPMAGRAFMALFNVNPGEALDG